MHLIEVLKQYNFCRIVAKRFPDPERSGEDNCKPEILGPLDGHFQILL
jgi:hypothetical protein